MGAYRVVCYLGMALVFICKQYRFSFFTEKGFYLYHYYGDLLRSDHGVCTAVLDSPPLF